MNERKWIRSWRGRWKERETQREAEGEKSRGLEYGLNGHSLQTNGFKHRKNEIKRNPFGKLMKCFV